MTALVTEREGFSTTACHRVRRAPCQLLAERAIELNRQIAASPHLGAQYEIGHTYFFDAAYFGGRWLKAQGRLHGGPFWKPSGKHQPSLDDLWVLSVEPVPAQYLEGIAPEEARDELARLRATLFSGDR